ncbi:MAG: thiamine pyrophosphate-dependent dehydrogenase E1 component subunit alpha, partial [Elusimicrobiaceae bacterium]
EDYVFSTHRNHGHYLSKGADLKPIVAELYGRSSGCAKGKGGSMHFVDTAINCMGTSAIVGGGIPLAVGAALAVKLKKENRLSAAYFGDGASDEGVLQESLNFAALKKLPALFVCENNFYATNSPQSARHAEAVISKRASAFGIPCALADGNDVEAVCAAAEKAVSHIRSGNGPYFLEFPTYRWKGHVGPECDYEKGCRPKAELDEWMKRCPIRTYAEKLKAEKSITQDEIDELNKKLSAQMEEAWKTACESPYPATGDLLTDVYYNREAR